MDYYDLLQIKEAKKGEQEAGQNASSRNGFLFFCNGGFLRRNAAGGQLYAGSGRGFGDAAGIYLVYDKPKQTGPAAAEIPAGGG